jgi:hypothetical protein
MPGAVAPQTSYARSGDVHIAYQVVGDGPLDLVWIPSLAHPVELGDPSGRALANGRHPGLGDHVRRPGTAELKGIRVTGVCSRSSRKRLRRMDAW